ncbi:MAG: DUF1780 domain-containing protein [Pseudomonadota bacterium]|nr:DUF1780 domain-containing protein [Gammaproteobacteria bacterium]MDQ3583513.1 DUF1780 domain-containing protein [Pseudomonadota bacterium]
MTDDEYLEAQRKARAESVEFFRSSKKPERERWVVHEFLANLGVAFEDSEVQSLAQDPPDVKFREANFEIKEILSEGRRRHQEYKVGLQKALEATSPADLVEMYTPRDVAVFDVCASVYVDAKSLAQTKYSPEARKSLDLLFYVNLTDVSGLKETPFPDLAPVEALGWRPVSFLMRHRSCTLTAASDAPLFLRGALKRIVHRKVN